MQKYKNLEGRQVCPFIYAGRMIHMLNSIYNRDSSRARSKCVVNQ